MVSRAQKQSQVNPNALVSSSAKRVEECVAARTAVILSMKKKRSFVRLGKTERRVCVAMEER